MTCGDVNDPDHPWSGVIMKSTCSFYNDQDTSNCKTVQRLDMTLEKELPVFDWTQNVTYRSIPCARCNNAGTLSLWGLLVSCVFSSGSIATPVNITAVKTFVKEHPGCSWKYAPRNNNQQYNSCVLHDAPCASNPRHLRVLSVVKELCSLYSMVFSIDDKLKYRNPHCALCNPNGRPLREAGDEVQSLVPPFTILLDVSTSIPNSKEPADLPPTLVRGPSLQDFDLTS